MPDPDRTRDSQPGRSRAMERRQGTVANALGSPLSMESDSSWSGDPEYSQDSSQMSTPLFPTPQSRFAPVSDGTPSSAEGPAGYGPAGGTTRGPGSPRHRPTPSWPSLSPLGAGQDFWEEAEEDPNERFEILQQLGRGSYGSVYKALERSTGQIVAIKVIPLGDQDELADIRKEIGFLAACDHPNIVRYLGSWRAKDCLWIAMEYCSGGSISDIMAATDAPLDEDLIAFVCGETLKGLAYLHTMGKVHRDIKCGNILLMETGEVKLADFGVAAQLTSTMTKRNTFIGTPHWMAPEVIQESRYDGKVDVWALGISAIEMAEVTPPRWAVHPMRVIFMISRDPPPRLADEQRWSLTLQDFVATCLQKEPSQRPSAGDLRTHRFVEAANRQAAQAALLPLIRRSRDHLSAASAMSADTGPLHITETSEGAIGQFSWPDDEATGTVRFSGAPDGPSEPAEQAPWMSAAGGEYGTLVVHDSGTFVRSGSYGGNSSDGGDSGGGFESRAGGGMDTVVQHGGGGGADYMQAVRSAMLENDGYMAAVEAAAASRRREAQRPQWALPPPGVRSGATGGEAGAEMAGLRRLYESGAVVPLPFLTSSQLPPAALLADAREGWYLPSLESLHLSCGVTRAVRPGEWLAELAELAAEGTRANVAANAGTADSASIHAPAAKLPGAVAGPEAPPTSCHDGFDAYGRGARGQGVAGSVPPAALEQAAASPIIRNLLQAVAYQRRILEEEALTAAEQDRAQGTVDDLTDSLRTILCL